MFFASIISSVYLLVGAAAIDPAIALIQTRHLETPEGRIEFLNGELKDFVTATDRLNGEIIALSNQIAEMDMENATEEKKREIAALGSQLDQKMSTLLAALPMLQNALKIDEDLQRIDAILVKEEPLDASERETLDRLVSLCQFLNQLPDARNLQNP